MRLHLSEREQLRRLLHCLNLTTERMPVETSEEYSERLYGTAIKEMIRRKYTPNRPATKYLRHCQ